MRTLFAAFTVMVVVAACGGGGGGGGSGAGDGSGTGSTTGGSSGGTTAAAPALINLTASGGSLVPTFQPAVTSYSVMTPFLGNAVTLTPSAAAGLTIKVDEAPVASGSASQALPVSITSATRTRDVPIVVSNDTLSATYAVAVVREDASSLAQQAFIKAANADPNDRFAYSLAVSTNPGTLTLAVGAPGESNAFMGIPRIGTRQNLHTFDADNSAPSAGAVYLFVGCCTPPFWSQNTYVKASNTDARDAFGTSVALSADGNTLAVGAINEASGSAGVDGNQSDNSKFGAGAVYVFTRSGDLWNQQAYLKASNPDANDFFGSSLALSADGNTLSVGAIGEDSATRGVNGNQLDNNATNAGAAYVFTRTGTTWSQQAYVKASNADAGDSFGSSIALSADGNTLSVGAQNEGSAALNVGGNQADNSRPGEGAAYVFVRSGATWTQQAYLKATTGAFGQVGTAPQAFGTAMSLSADGNRLAVSAPNAWVSVGSFTRVNAGSVSIYARSGTTWTVHGYVSASNADSNDGFGAGAASVRLTADGNTLVVGSPGEAGGTTGVNGNVGDNSLPASGAVYVFTGSEGSIFPFSAWHERAYIKATNTATVDGKGFGNAVAIAADGTLIIGADRDDVSSIDINNAQIVSPPNVDYGSVTVYK